MTVFWSETAASQLQAVRDFLAKSSPAYARTLAARITKRTRILETFPLAGVEVAEYGNPTVRELFEHPYRIIYCFDGTEIQILAVIHSSRRLPRQPPG